MAPPDSVAGSRRSRVTGAGVTVDVGFATVDSGIAGVSAARGAFRCRPMMPAEYKAPARDPAAVSNPARAVRIPGTVDQNDGSTSVYLPTPPAGHESIRVFCHGRAVIWMMCGNGVWRLSGTSGRAARRSACPVPRGACLPNSLRIVSSSGSIIPARLARMTASQSGSNFFQPAAYVHMAQASRQLSMRRRAAHNRSPFIEAAIGPPVPLFELVS